MHQSKSSSYLSPWLGLFAAIAFAALLWLPGLSEYYINGDEALHLRCTELVFKNPLGAWKQIMKNHAHPALYMYLLSLVRLLFGFTEIIPFKIPSILFGTLTLTMGYVWGSRAGARPWIGAITFLLLATSPLVGEQSQLIRGYALLLLLITTMYFFLTKPSFDKKDLIFSLAVFCLAFLTHYSALILSPTIFFAVFFRTKHWSQLERYRALTGIALLAMAMGLLLATTSLKSPYDLSYAFLPLKTPKDFLNLINKVFNAFFGPTASWLPITALVVSLPFMIKQRSWSTLVLSWAPLAVALFIGYFQLYPFNHLRHVVYLIPSTLVPVIYLLSLVKGDLLPKAALGMLIIIGATSQAFQANRYRGNGVEFALHRKELRPLAEEIITGKFEDGIFVLDRQNYTLMQVERELRPKWKLIWTERQQFAVCDHSKLQAAGYCSCADQISRKYPNIKKLYLLVAKTAVTQKNTQESHKNCFAEAETVALSKHFSLARLNVN